MTLKCECGFVRIYEGETKKIDKICPKCKKKMEDNNG